MKRLSHGFTIIEILFVVVLLGAASVLFFVQKNGLEVVARDEASKTAINAMYYSLEEVFYPTNKFYPQSIGSDSLKSMDPSLFTDTNGVKIGETGSTYTYEPTNCVDSKCQGYTLKTTLENEADFIKINRNN
ncbi:MAG: type II secretion system protein [Candidatus Saccharibacteria bacterium]